MPRPGLVACLCLIGFSYGHSQTVDEAFFEKKIRPILVDQCQSGHGEKKQKRGLRVDTLQALLAGGESGPSLVPGKPDESLLVRVIEQGEPYAMPPKGKLTRDQISNMRLWVKAGAPWPGATTG
ncbi:MAG: c-type cytochrome domain-containing protein, partial [Gemmataceae bacterium]